jgi:hypothetical protein
MKKIIVWGTGIEYDRYISNIELEKLKGNIDIIGVTSNENWLCNLGDYPFVSKDKLSDMLFDYIVVFSSKFFEEICREALLYGINRNQIINGAVFGIPYFDFNRYTQVKESNITIVSNHCWGGWIYVNTLDSNLSFYFFFYYLGIQNIKLLRFSPDSKSYIPKQLYKFARTPLESYS